MITTPSSGERGAGAAGIRIEPARHGMRSWGHGRAACCPGTEGIFPSIEGGTPLAPGGLAQTPLDHEDDSASRNRVERGVRRIS